MENYMRNLHSLWKPLTCLLSNKFVKMYRINLLKSCYSCILYEKGVERYQGDDDVEILLIEWLSWGMQRVCLYIYDVILPGFCFLNVQLEVSVKDAYFFFQVGTCIVEVHMYNVEVRMPTRMYILHCIWGLWGPARLGKSTIDSELYQGNWLNLRKNIRWYWMYKICDILKRSLWSFISSVLMMFPVCVGSIVDFLCKATAHMLLSQVAINVGLTWRRLASVASCLGMSATPPWEGPKLCSLHSLCYHVPLQ